MVKPWLEGKSMMPTRITIDGEKFLFNGVPTHAARSFEGHQVEGAPWHPVDPDPAPLVGGHTGHESDAEASASTGAHAARLGASPRPRTATAALG